MKRKQNSRINASSMADIAFLLLVFFLVATEITADEGIGVTLPAWVPNFEPPPSNDRNVLAVSINARDELMVEDKEMEVEDLRVACKKFITNNGKDPLQSDSPQKAIVSLKGDRGSSYGTYINVYNELIGAYKDLRNEMTIEETAGRVAYFADLDRSTADSTVWTRVKSAYPIRLSEAEPTDFALEEAN